MKPCKSLIFADIIQHAKNKIVQSNDLGWELLYVLIVHPEQLINWKNLKQLDNLISSLLITLTNQQVTASGSCERQ